jgi:hypothetical protein
VSYKSCSYSVHGPSGCGQNRDLAYSAICCLGGGGGGWGGDRENKCTISLGGGYV